MAVSKAGSVSEKTIMYEGSLKGMKFRLTVLVDLLVQVRRKLLLQPVFYFLNTQKSTTSQFLSDAFLDVPTYLLLVTHPITITSTKSNIFSTILNKLI